MFEGFMARMTGFGATPHSGIDRADFRAAAAGLMVHVVATAGPVAEAMRYRLETVLAATFALRPSEARRLVEAAIAADPEVTDLSDFTDTLNRNLDRPERQRIIAMTRDLVRLDGDSHECEEALIDRAAELLGLASVMLATERVRA